MAEPVKVHDLFAHKPDISVEEFHRYWASGHAELACTFPQIKHYVQSHRIDGVAPPAGFGPTWPDGCAETWYDDLASIEEMVASPRFSAELMVDETRFMNLGNPRPLLVSREALLDEDGFEPEGERGVKLLIFAARPAGTGRDEFLAAWAGDDDVALGRRLGATRHVVWTPVTEGGVLIQNELDAGDEQQDSGGGSYDAVRELWWPDEAAMAAATAAENDDWQALLRPAAADAARSMTLPARERVIIL
ncbi:MAG: EthD domain-containing protein [Actinobacteria bacterium]|nr:EthD domain-containing protein [Actinomycetota bacterium]